MEARELRIFARRDHVRGPTRPSHTPPSSPLPIAPRVAVVTTPPPVAAEPVPVVVPSVAPIQPAALAFEAEILAVLEAQAEPGETIDAAFRRKEAALRDVFSRLSLVEAFGLHERLVDPQPGDLLASRFKLRLMADRRARLVAFLADARRRETIGSIRR